MPPAALPATPARRQTALFWLCLLGLNGLLFLPNYWLNRDNAVGFWPWSAEQHLPLREWAVHLFVWRDNPDIWRLNVELIALTAVWALVGRWAIGRRRLRRTATGAATAGYLVTLLYYAYESGMRTLFQQDANFYSQLQLARDGAPLLIAHLRVAPWMAGLGVLALLVATAGLAAAVRALVWGGARLGRPSQFVLLVLAAAALAQSIAHRRAAAAPKMAVSSVVWKVADNLARSAELVRAIEAFDSSEPERVYNYDDFALLRKPNIYLIFVESYGSILYTHPVFRPGYLALLDDLEAELTTAGWQGITALSTAPTWGGGSWLSYTSVLFGLRVDNHPQYLNLQERYQTERYPDLGTWLRNQGYTYTWVSSLDGELPRQQAKANRLFFGMDRWLQHADLGYVGPGFGWGPAPPDQFVLGFLRETVVQTAEPDAPQLLFFITQNSHYPWDPLPTRTADWRDLNDPALPSPSADPMATLAAHVKRQNYLAAMRYQLETLIDWIAATAAEEDALFVLIGDHQPQQVSFRKDGFATPVHVISRDGALLRRFLPYGFTPGLHAAAAPLNSAPDPELRHEGLYSLLMYALLSRYGLDTRLPPPVRLHGIVPAGAEQSALSNGG